MTVDMTIETGHSLRAVGLFGLAVGSGVELLLRELRHEESHPLQVFGVQDPAEDLLKVVDSQHFPLRDVSQIGTGREENGRRKFRQVVIGQIEIEVEALQARQQLDLDLWED